MASLRGRIDTTCRAARHRSNPRNTHAITGRAMAMTGRQGRNRTNNASRRAKRGGRCKGSSGGGSHCGIGIGGGCGGVDDDILLEKRHLIDRAMNSTSCAGCIASVRSLLNRPLSELRMLKAIVDEDGTTALRLKDDYLRDDKKREQLFDTFPMSSVHKKVQPAGSSQRCQMHRRGYAYSSGGVTAGGTGGSGHRGGADSGSGILAGYAGILGGAGAGKGLGPGESWDWEDAWERMPHDLRVDVATVKGSVLEAAVRHVTEGARFCSDCRHNVVHAYDLLMGKVDITESEESEDEFNEELFQPFGDRLCSCNQHAEKVLHCDVMDVEDLIYWHQDFTSQEFDGNSTGGQQRHAATLEQGQREVRSIVGAVLLAQLRSVWFGHAAQVQAEQYLFCLVVDAVRTDLAARASSPSHASAALDLLLIEGCANDNNNKALAGEGRRQKRRQKKREKKRANKSVSSSSSCTASVSSCASSSPSSISSTTPASISPPRPLGSSVSAAKDRSSISTGGGGAGSGASGAGSAAAPAFVAVEKQVRTSSGIASTTDSHGGFGASGLAFQLGCDGGDSDDFTDDEDVDHDLLFEMEQLKHRVRSRTEIDFLRKTLRQNYDRFISNGAGGGGGVAAAMAPQH